jgi:hypothetical protein
MATWACRGCTAVYSVDASRCPQCGADDHYEEGTEEMPKITLHGGPSNAATDDTTVEGEGVNVETAGGPFKPLPDVTDNEELANTEKVVKPDYPKWNVEQLRDQLASRDLAKTGNKDELIARLLDDDAAREAAEQGTE